jgi:hypothetical protein
MRSDSETNQPGKEKNRKKRMNTKRKRKKNRLFNHSIKRFS